MRPRWSEPYSVWWSAISDPTSVPMAQVGGQGMVIDLADNKLLWFKPFVVTQAAQGEWDEPTYTNLSNAFYQAVDNSRQQMITPFAQ